MIILNAVTKRYGALAAVNNVSYTVKKGEHFALLGPNGAGKTTIVRMLLGFSPPSSGTLLIDGISTRDSSARKNIGYLAEQHRIPPYLSGGEYLMRHAALIGMSHAEAKREIGRVVEIVGMQGKENKKSATYSRGMLQRIGLGAAILGRPALLILDEPVSGLDPLGIRDVRKILDDLRQDGVTMMLNSHLLSEVEKTCDTAAIMHEGSIIIKDSISSIVNDGETLEDVFIRYVEKKHV